MMKKTNENSYLFQFMTRYSKACTKMKCTVCYSFILTLSYNFPVKPAKLF